MFGYFGPSSDNHASTENCTETRKRCERRGTGESEVDRTRTVRWGNIADRQKRRKISKT